MTLSPHITSRLRPYQPPAVSTLVSGFSIYNSLIDTSDMGCGKSFVALATALALRKEPYLLVRKAAIPTWRRYLKHFNIDPEQITITNLEAIKSGKRESGTWVEAFTRSGRKYKKFVWEVPENNLLIWDEVHGASGLDSKAGRMLISAAFQKIPTLMLSATAADSPLKMKAIGFALGLHRVTDFLGWLLAHGCVEGRYGYEFTCGMKPGEYLQYESKTGKWKKRSDGWAELLRRRAEHMEAIHRQIFPAGKGVRIKQSEVPGFPKNTIIPEAIDFQSATKEIAAAYRELQFELARLHKKFDAGPLLKKTQTKVEMLKLPIIAEQVKDEIDQGYSVVVFTNFNDSMDEMCRLLKTDCFIRGGQNPEERSRNEDRFQDPNHVDWSPVIVANNQAGGESLNFHDLDGNHPRVTHIFPTFWAQVFRQCSGRAPRQGGLTPVIQKIPFAAGTVEEEAFDSVLAKLAQVDTFNNGTSDPVATITDDDLTAGLGIV